MHKQSLSDKIIAVKPVLAAVEMCYTRDALKKKKTDIDLEVLTSSQRGKGGIGSCDSLWTKNKF